MQSKNKDICFFLFILLLLGCKPTEKADCQTSKSVENSALTSLPKSNENHNTKPTDNVSFRRYTPDTLRNYSYDPFSIYESYQIKPWKLLFGYYASEDGSITSYDTETNYGKRLLALNNEDQLVFTSKGSCDLFQFTPHFFISDDEKQIVILCQEAYEYFCGARVFLIENNEILELGTLNVETVDERKPITYVTVIHRINQNLEFTFDSDKLILDPGGEDLPFENNGFKYMYQNGVFIQSE